MRKREYNPLLKRVECMELELMEMMILDALECAGKMGVETVNLMDYVNGRSQASMFATVLNRLQDKELIFHHGDVYDRRYYLTCEFN